MDSKPTNGKHHDGKVKARRLIVKEEEKKAIFMDDDGTLFVSISTKSNSSPWQRWFDRVEQRTKVDWY